MRRYTFAPLQAMHYTPPQLVQLAAQAGIWGVGLRLTPVVPGALHYPLHDDPALLRETQAVLRDTGIVVLNAEAVLLHRGHGNGFYGVVIESPLLARLLADRLAMLETMGEVVNGARDDAA